MGRFMRDLRDYHLKYIDFMHYTVPLVTCVGANWKFPSEYMGQYGVFEAVRHIYRQSSQLRSLVSEDGSELHVSQRYFSTDTEKAIQEIRSRWRAQNGIGDD